MFSIWISFVSGYTKNGGNNRFFEKWRHAESRLSIFRGASLEKPCASFWRVDEYVNQFLGNRSQTGFNEMALNWKEEWKKKKKREKYVYVQENVFIN